MTRRSLDQTLDFIQRVDRAATYEEVCAALLEIARRHGITHMLAGTMPPPGANRSVQLGHVVLDHWPEEWARRYFSHGYLFVDPAIRRCREARAPFLWSELGEETAADPSARRVMNEAGEFGLRAGLTVPLATLEGEFAGVSFAGDQVEIDPQTRGMLTLLATYALGRGLQLHASGAARLRPRLSPREREALQFAAEGKTQSETADLMRISEHGVDKHIRTAKQKLGTRTRTHAVAEAIRLGLVE